MTSQWRTDRDREPATARLLVERAHEELIAGNAEDARLRDVRGVVRESWRRSLAERVDPDGPPPIAFTAAQLRDYRDAHPLAATLPVIRRLLVRDAEEAGVIVAIGDAMGRLLWVEGDRGLRTIAGDMGFVEGANWSERAVGTAAPGTALELDRGVQIHTAEHFNRLVHPWSCTAVPVHDPESRAILGVIDITGGAEVVTPQALMLLQATAQAAESELLVDRLRRRSAPRPPARRPAAASPVTDLAVLGVDRARLSVGRGDDRAELTLSARHAEILLLLAFHPQGLSAERLAELLYGEGARIVSLRAELVRLRRALESHAPQLVPESRPYRLGAIVESDAHHVVALLRRGAHRAALAGYRGPVLPGSTAPGVTEIRDRVATELREAILTDATLDVLLEYAATESGLQDEQALTECLRLLPPRSPKRAAIVAALERLAAD